MLQWLKIRALSYVDFKEFLRQFLLKIARNYTICKVVKNFLKNIVAFFFCLY